MSRKYTIWIDDERNPYSEIWRPVATNKTFFEEEPVVVWLKSYDEFVAYLNQTINSKENSFPSLVCFDHDLGERESGMDCAKYLVNFCIDNNLELPNYTCHSSNPVGRENILSYLDSYIKSLQ